eukprot:6527388-Pyramimonas_sp.AAC.1
MVADLLRTPTCQLRQGDVLVPSQTLHRVKDFFDCPLPVDPVFWRFPYDSNGARSSSVIRRNPIFGDACGIDPCTHCAIDLMHTLCYGPIQRWASCVLWRIVT